MEEESKTILVKCDSGDKFTLTGRPCEISAFSFVPARRNLPKERTYFNSEIKEKYSSSTYDRMFNVDYGFDNKLHRCDREHAKSKGLTVNDEERLKDTPTLSSSVYGKYVLSPNLDPPDRKVYSELDPPDRKHVRVAHVKTEFYRRNGIGLPVEQAN